MNKQEYNRDVKRLRKFVNQSIERDNDTVAHIHSEFHRLYGADETFSYANKESVVTLLRINLLFRFVPLHLFGIYIDL